MWFHRFVHTSLDFIVNLSGNWSVYSLGQKKNSCVSGSLPEKNRVGR